ncbi:Gfo/Idh/MocA family oxidoreductase [Chitinophaga sp.]|uniref:Gfo/Idh/MocA family protein n=1 Tax=Chitinophaga sp. TaxID=1869181 RepID=UPI0031DCF3F8
MENSRRDFIKKLTTGSAAVAFGGLGLGFSAKSYARIVGSNEMVRVALMGCNGRGSFLARAFTQQKNTSVHYICDVDPKAIQKGLAAVRRAGGSNDPKTEEDFRKALADKDVDALAVAAPDHWHAPATIMGCQAGKHVYCEKPLSHNPNEGELAIAAARKYKRIVQMGSQRRSWPVLTQGIQELHNGVIGNVHMAKAWYTNNRGSIGKGVPATPPAGFNYDLWQGPAPRKPFRSNLIHYNWHWFWHWGTGEALNNGTHEIDVIRWGLKADYPLLVNSTGGRFHYQDDWETPDTQLITYNCPGNVTVLWEGRSCNGRLVEGADRGVIFYGESGSMSTGGNSYTIYDQKNKIVKEVKSDAVIDGRNTASPSEGLDAIHITNFIDSIRQNKMPNADVETGHKSTLWVQLGNIAQRVGHTLNIDQRNGHILNDKEASKYWSRQYEPGWAPKV